MKKEIGKEYPESDENLFVNEMVEELKGQMDQLFPSGTKMLRQAETKMHGCLKAKFIVDANLEEKYRVGVFESSRTYDTIIRFSNAKTGIVKDIAKDQRGIALKLLGVEGEKLILKEHLAGTQDFIGLNYETFVAKSVREFSKIIKAFTTGKIALLLFALNPLHWPLLRRVAKASSKVGSLLEENYWSTTAYQFGTDRAIKFWLKSNQRSKTAIPTHAGFDYLKDQMAAVLSKSEASFDFMVQFQEDADAMPVEDPTVKWNSKYIKLATLVIPAQTFDTDQNRIFGEALSFNPWHSLTVHRPLGALNRARLAIYGGLSDYRIRKNDQKIFEPVDMSFVVPD